MKTLKSTEDGITLGWHIHSGQKTQLARLDSIGLSFTIKFIKKSSISKTEYSSPLVEKHRLLMNNHVF